MKPVRRLEPVPPLYSDWFKENPDRGWLDLRDGDAVAQAAYQALKAGLTLAQQGLCAYCETELGPRKKVIVEHFVPRSAPAVDGFNHDLHPDNLLANCEGIGAGGKSCSQAKGNKSAALFLDPRLLPFPDVLVTCDASGTLHADKRACGAASIDPARVEGTLHELGLNCQRLKTLREAVWKKLLEDEDLSPLDPAVLVDQLCPDPEGKLKAFWTLRLSFLGGPTHPPVAQLLAEVSPDQLP